MSNRLLRNFLILRYLKPSYHRKHAQRGIRGWNFAKPCLSGSQGLKTNLYTKIRDPIFIELPGPCWVNEWVSEWTHSFIYWRCPKFYNDKCGYPSKNNENFCFLSYKTHFMSVLLSSNIFNFGILFLDKIGNLFLVVIPSSMINDWITLWVITP